MSTLTRADAAELAYDRRGSGPTLVLLHPLGADRHVWAPVIDRVAERRDVIALDLPGFGESPNPGRSSAITSRCSARRSITGAHT